MFSAITYFCSENAFFVADITRHCRHYLAAGERWRFKSSCWPWRTSWTRMFIWPTGEGGGPGGQSLGCWCWLPKLWQVRARLYRSRFIAVKRSLNGLICSIWNIFSTSTRFDTLLHRSKPKVRCGISQMFGEFSRSFAKCHWILIKHCNFKYEISRNCGESQIIVGRQVSFFCLR